MGAYLSEPKTTKESSDSESSSVRCGSSSMQGWRVSQEDAHNCILDYDKAASFFAVYDGHGGHEVAEYCSKHLPDFLKKIEKYTKGEFEEALKEAFLEFDAALTTAEVIEVLKTIAGRKEDGIEKACGGAEADWESEGEEAIDNLVEEAHMPLDEVIAKYAAAGPLYRVLKGEKGKPPVSPMLRGRREAGGSSSGDGPSCSSASSSSSPTKATVAAKGDAEVSSSSSSSQSAPLVNGESHTNGEVKETENIKTEVSGSDGKVEKKRETEKKPETEKKTEDAEVAGKSDMKKCERTEPDSSRPEVSNGQSHDVSSSSENGSVSSSSPTTRKKRIAPNVYQKLLQPNESESEDEDETFTAEAAESDEDSDDAGEGKEDEDEEDEESSEEDEELDEEEDEDYPGMEVKEEPGSDSGCTAVVALLMGSQLYVANAGDSRCVLCRDGKAVDLSFDHKPEDEPERERIQKAGGRVTCDGRVNGGLNLSRAIGDHSYKQVKELSAREQMISALPDVKVETVNLETDEFMVLACDGIWNSMTSQQVVDFVRTKLEQKTERLSQICEELFNVCLAPDTMGDGTGCDNMTCVIVQFKRPPSNKRPADEQEQEPNPKKSKVEEQVTST